MGDEQSTDQTRTDGMTETRAQPFQPSTVPYVPYPHFSPRYTRVGRSCFTPSSRSTREVRVTERNVE